MTQTQTWCERMNDNVPVKGNMRRNPIPLSTIRNSTGLGLSGATTPIIEISSSALRISWVANDSAAVNLTIPIPADYCEDERDGADHFKIILLMKMGGATDTPTISGDGVIERKAVAQTALDADASAAVTGTTLAEYEIDLSGQGFKAGDAVTINLTPGAHTTDALYLYGAWLEVREQWVATDESIR